MAVAVRQSHRTGRRVPRKPDGGGAGAGEGRGHQRARGPTIVAALRGAAGQRPAVRCGGDHRIGAQPVRCPGSSERAVPGWGSRATGLSPRSPGQFRRRRGVHADAVDHHVGAGQEPARGSPSGQAHGGGVGFADQLRGPGGGCRSGLLCRPRITAIRRCPAARVPGHPGRHSRVTRRRCWSQRDEDSAGQHVECMFHPVVDSPDRTSESAGAGTAYQHNDDTAIATTAAARVPGAAVEGARSLAYPSIRASRLTLTQALSSP